MKKIPTFLVISFTLALFSLPFVSKAQDGPDGPGDPGSDIPFDGGVSIFVATAVGYGIKKMKKKKLEIEAE